MKETWKDIKDYKGLYKVSSCSRILGIKYNRILKQRLKRGYSNICLCKNGIKREYRVHRILAIAFISNPDNKPYINHKNGIRDDNRLENIEWCTNSENQLHSYQKLGRVHPRPTLGKTGVLCKNSKSLYQLDLNGMLIKIWGSTADVTRELGFNNISLACTRGVIRHGYKWEYFKSGRSFILSPLVNIDSY